MRTMQPEVPGGRFAPLDESERLPRESLRVPWHERTQGKAAWAGFAWPVAFVVVTAGTWWLTQSIVVVWASLLLLAGVFWRLTRK